MESKSKSVRDDKTWADYEREARPKLRALALRLFRQNVDNAEDLLQDTFVRAYQKFQNYKPERGRFDKWVASIMVNLWREYLSVARNREIPISNVYWGQAWNYEPAFDPNAAKVWDGGFKDLTFDVEMEAISNLTLEEMLTPLNPEENRVARMLSDGVPEEKIRAVMELNLARYEALISGIREKIRALVN